MTCCIAGARRLGQATTGGPSSRAPAPGTSQRHRVEKMCGCFFVCVLRVPFVGLSGNPRGKPLVFGPPYVHLGIMAHADCHHRFGLGKGKDNVGPRSHEHVLPSLPNHDILLSCHVMQVFDVIVSRGSISLPMDKLYPCISFKVLKAVFFQGSCRRIPMTKIPRHVGRWFIAVFIQLV